MWVTLLKSILVPLLSDLLKFLFTTQKETASQTSSPLVVTHATELEAVIKKYESVGKS